MKKMCVIIIGVVVSFVLFSSLASAQGHGGGHFGGYGGYHGGYGYRGGYYGGYRGYYGGRYYGGYWGWGWGWPYSHSYPYSSYSPYSVPPAPLESGQQQPYYWYFCQDPKGYYPYVKDCPGGWMKVVPNVTPSQAGEEDIGK